MTVGVTATAGSRQVVAARRGAVAQRALHSGVQASEREAGVVVVKGGIGPIDHVVAGIAGGREVGSDVVRNAAAQSGGALPIRLVAEIAGGVGGGTQRVVVRGVALVAIRHHAGGRHLVVALEGPAGRGMSPGSGGECRRGRVAVPAVYRREGRACRRVHRIIRAAVIAGMTVGVTATAGCRQVVAARRGAVAERALHSGVQAGEREAGVVVVKGGIRPIDHVVAGIAGLWEPGRNMVWHIPAQGLRALPIRLVAEIASGVGGGTQRVVVRGVALVAIRHHAGGRHLVVALEGPAGRGMSPGSGGECRRGRVAVPAVYRREGRACRRVHRIIRAAVIAGMTVGVTAATGCRQVVAARGGAVAQGASNAGVQTGEREAGVVVVKGGIGPIDHVVAGIAGGREVGSDVVRNAATQSGGALPIRLVAEIAGGVGGGAQRVVVADVALVAIGDHAGGSHLVVALEGPAGGCYAVGPGSGGEVGGGGVAVRAVCRCEGCARRRVHRIIRAAVIAGMTVGITAAARCRQVVATRRGAVALRALHRGVQAGKRESGVVVVKGGIGPIDHVVAGIAGGREVGSDVVRNAAAQSRGALPIRLVAEIASGVRGGAQGVVVAGVALVAIGDHA